MSRFIACLGLVLSAGCANRSLPARYDVAAIPEDTLVTIAGPTKAGASGTPAYGFVDAADPLDALFHAPFDITYAPDGSLYIVDTQNYRIRAIDHAGVLRTVAGSGIDGEMTGSLLKASFSASTQLVFRDTGVATLAAALDSEVKDVDFTEALISNECGLGIRTEYTGDGGDAEDAALDVPLSVAVRDGNTYILDSQNQVIRMIDEGGTITHFAGTCVVAEAADGSACNGSAVACPDSDKTTTCTDENACERLCTPGYAGDGGPASALRMAQPGGESALDGGRLAFDRDGNLYFTDTDNHRIRKIDRAGVVTTIAGTGIAGKIGDGGPAVFAELNRPVDLVFDTDGTLYVADTGNSCIRAIGIDGNIRTIAGVCGEPGYAGPTGPATSAFLNHPRGIDVDHAGILYIADTSNNIIRAMRTPPTP